MIAKLIGIIDEIFEDYAILNVSGVGYQIYSTSKMLSSLHPSQGISLYIETHVREDHIHLYGFMTNIDKRCFQILQTVSGVGAKVALSIMSLLTIFEIQEAIVNRDKTTFCRVSGIGSKLAERILLELKDKHFIEHSIQSNGTVLTNMSLMDDATSALINLGINKNEATSVVRKILDRNPAATIDEVIHSALKNRGQ
jgi:Holliday junction DNA helicase RuvA